MRRTDGWQMVSVSWMTLLVGGFIVGLLLTVRAGNPVKPVIASRTYASDITVNTVTELRARQHELKAELKRLRDEQDGLQRQATSNQGNLEDIRSEIDIHKQIAGLTPLRGPGVEVLLDDSKASVAPDAADVNRYIIHQQQLVATVGVLWSSGAEAIAINDQRITDQTSIYCVGSTVIINQELLAPPFTVRAIGEPARLEQAIQASPLLGELWQRQQENGLVVSVRQQKQVQVPAYGGTLGSRHLEATP
ncbi:MAG TPA: DUF881 domain-containing protein [Herpetosiphonaceae bacterium]